MQSTVTVWATELENLLSSRRESMPPSVSTPKICSLDNELSRWAALTHDVETVFMVLLRTGLPYGSRDRIGPVYPLRVVKGDLK